jgi:hypothetical protein
LRFAKAQSEDRDRRQIERNDRQVDRIEPVDAGLRFESAGVDESCEGARLSGVPQRVAQDSGFSR